MGIGPATTILFENAEGVYVPVSVDNPLPSTGTGGGGAVDSVNGQTGVVVLESDDIHVVVGGTDTGTVTEHLSSVGDSIVGLNESKVGSSNSSVHGIEYYPDVASLPAEGTTGVIYVVPVV